MAVDVLENRRVPMRDGARLAADVYLPAGGPPDRALPVILERTPYDKRGVSRSESLPGADEPATRRDVGRWFARRGYAVVVQDCRGRYASEGHFRKYLDEANDGVDTLKWIREQAWCNGRIGTMGLSYGAHTQLALASLNPPGLASMFVDSGGFSNAFASGIRQGGTFEMKQATWALRHARLSPLTAADPVRQAKLAGIDIAEWLRKLSWSPGNSPLSAAPEFEEYFFDQWSKATFDDFWRRAGLFAAGYYENFPRIPVAIVGSWYDPYVRSCIDNFLGLRAAGCPEVCLLMGPWTHGDRDLDFSGDVSFGADATLQGGVQKDYFELRLAWFERHLKSLAAEPFAAPVTYFQMGGGAGTKNDHGRLRHGGRWRLAQQWPPENTQPIRYYLAPAGALQHKPSTGNAEYLEFAFDPRDPVPTIGGAVTSGEPVMHGGAFDQVQQPDTFAVRPTEKPRPLAEREDVLVFQTQRLSESLLISGPVVAELWVSSDRPDTDITIKLVDVYPPNEDYPAGYAMNLCDGIFRLRFHAGWEHEQALENGRVYRLEVHAFDISNLVACGHRLRIDVSSSNYPRFDVNPNTGKPTGDMDGMSVARNRLYCSADYPSNLRLKVARQ